MRRHDSTRIDPARTGPGGARGWEPHPGVRTGKRLRPGERAADLFCRAAGSWAFLLVVAVAVLAGAAEVLRGGDPAGGLAGLTAGLCAVTLLEVSVLLIAARRAERIAADLTRYNLDLTRRATALAEDLRDEVERLHTAVARVAAYTEKVRPGGPMLGR